MIETPHESTLFFCRVLQSLQDKKTTAGSCNWAAATRRTASSYTMIETPIHHINWWHCARQTYNFDTNLYKHIGAHCRNKHHALFSKALQFICFLNLFCPLSHQTSVMFLTDLYDSNNTRTQGACHSTLFVSTVVLITHVV